MLIHPEHIKSVASLSGLDIPEEDLLDVAVRLSAMLTALEEFELEMGDRIDAFEPIPPVYASEEALVEFYEA